MLTRIILGLLVSVALFAQGMRIPGNRIIEGTINYGADAQANDTYVITLTPAITSYITGSCYTFKANTANTGAASLNINGLGAKTLKKAAGGVTTDLSDNDIRAGQLVYVCYDGTNMQMQSNLGNQGPSTNQQIRPLSAVINSASDPIPCNLNRTAVTISEWSIAAETSGNATIDIKTVAKASWNGRASTSSITASATPAISGAIYGSSTTLTGWTVAVPADTWVCFSPSGVTAGYPIVINVKASTTN